MKILNLTLMLLVSTIAYSQSTFSKLIKLEGDEQMGMKVAEHLDSIFIVSSLECGDFDCTQLIITDEEGNNETIVGAKAFNLSVEGDLLLDADGLGYYGYTNSEERDTGFYYYLTDPHAVEEVFVGFDIKPEGYGEIIHKGLITENGNINAYIYGTNMPDNRDNAFLLTIDNNGNFIDTLSWDEGNKNYSLVNMIPLGNDSLAYLVDEVPQGVSLTQRSVKTINRDKEIETLWKSPLLLSSVRSKFAMGPNGNYFVVAPNTESNITSLSPFIYSVSPTGEENWVFEFPLDAPFVDSRTITDMYALDDGNLVGVGAREKSDINQEIGWMFKISSSGELLWERSYSEFDYFNDKFKPCALNEITATEDGGLLATGFMKETAFSVSPNRVWLLKVDGEGCFNFDDCGVEQNVNSTNELDEFDVSVFPNPVGDQLHIDIENTACSFKLLDVNGKLLKSGKENTVDLSGLSKGVYLLRVKYNGKLSRLKKIIKF